MTCYMRGVRSRRSFNKRIDLQPGEYQRLDERQPFFGVAAIPLLKVGVSVWIIGYCLAWLSKQVPFAWFVIIAPAAAWVMVQAAKGRFRHGRNARVVRDYCRGRLSRLARSEALRPSSAKAFAIP